MKLYRIFYEGELLFSHLTEGAVVDIMEDIADQYYNGELIDPTKIELKEFELEVQDHGA